MLESCSLLCGNCVFDLSNHRGIFNRRRDLVFLLVDNAPQSPAEDLAGPGLWQSLHHIGFVVAGERSHTIPESKRKANKKGEKTKKKQIKSDEANPIPGGKTLTRCGPTRTFP